jgi:hypothetical protein
LRKSLREIRRRPAVQGVEEETVRKRYECRRYVSGNNLRDLENNAIQIVRKEAGPDLVAEWTFMMFEVVRMNMDGGLIESQKNQTDDEYSNPFHIAEIEKSLAFHLLRIS